MCVCIPIDPISSVELKHVGGPAILNESFTLSCEANVPVEKVHWLRDGTVIYNSTGNNNNMTVSRAQLSDDGEYKCEAFNAVSNKTSNTYSLLVNCKYRYKKVSHYIYLSLYIHYATNVSM